MFPDDPLPFILLDSGIDSIEHYNQDQYTRQWEEDIGSAEQKESFNNHFIMEEDDHNIKETFEIIETFPYLTTTTVIETDTIHSKRKNTRTKPVNFKRKKSRKAKKRKRRKPLRKKIIKRFKARPAVIRARNVERLRSPKTIGIKNLQKPRRPRFQLRLDKVARIASAMTETVDAVLALTIPGHEEHIKKRKDERLPLDQSLVLFSVTSGIVAAILSL